MDKSIGRMFLSFDVANAKNEFGLKERDDYNLPKNVNSRRPSYAS